jgi:Pyruvate/2-oxoacid:ferredoxin oxidoreductase delta subunit
MPFKNFFLKPSTRQFIAEARKMPGFGFLDLLHGLIYARWTNLYIAIGTGRHPLARLYHRLFPVSAASSPQSTTTFADGYHGKVLPLSSARQLVSIQEDISLPDLEKVIPYNSARAIILKNPDHIVALDCPCRLSRENPCLPLDVCLVVGEPFAGFIREHHPNHSRSITRQEALNILEAEDQRGHVHHAFFKDAMLGRFYAICNCCACCCGAMQSQRNGTPMLASSGYVAFIDEESCIACGACETSCQFAAIFAQEGICVVDAEKCMGCAVCVGQCSQESIQMRRDESKGEPLEIFQLMEKAQKVKSG